MQKKVPIAYLAPEQIKILDKKAAYAIFCGARPFSLYDEPNMREFLRLLQSAYNVPRQKTIGDRFLIECYNETYAEVLENIRKNDFIIVFIDESFTFTRYRVINYCIFVKAGSFCMEQVSVKIGLLTVESQADFLAERLDTLEAMFSDGERFPMINSMVTDTCVTMRFLWEKLGSKKRFKHTFFIPCDSHGL